MDSEKREQIKLAEKIARSLFDEVFQAKTAKSEIPIQVGQFTKHKFDIYEQSKFIGGITTLPWTNKTERKSQNTSGQDRVAAEFLWLSLYEGTERRIMILTDEEMALKVFKRWYGCMFPHSIEVIFCDLNTKKLKTIGILSSISSNNNY